MRSPADAPPPDERLAEWLVPGVAPADVPPLHPLLGARGAIQALITLFNGTEDAVLIRLLVLSEMAGRGGEPHFTAAELRQQFPYLDEGKLEHLIQRLRSHDILSWDAERSRYGISPLGRMVMAAVSQLLRYEDEGAELGFLAGQIAGSQAVGGVAVHELQHLLARLLELKESFESAILSGSEARIRRAAQQLQRVWQWVNKGSDVLGRLLEQEQLEPAAHRVAQRIGQVQSELLRMSGAFQRTLSQLETQKVHLGATGLSSTDVARWLAGRSQAELAALVEGAGLGGTQTGFVLGDIALDIAEFELIDKLRPERLDVPLPQALEASAGSAMSEAPEDFGELERWRDLLRVAPDGLALAEALPLRSYELSSYRLSLLSLLGDRESAALDGPVADLARLDRRLSWSGAVRAVGREGVEEMSEGHLRNPHGN
ncbi:MAG TPA: hypothetical protein VFV27_07470 [Nevskiaceae bacterium]|nr:hypothetical protein [Nevskiaceae bacterium]